MYEPLRKLHLPVILNKGKVELEKDHDFCVEGDVLTPEQAQAMHAFIRQTLTNHYDAAMADAISILYGGSVKPANAKEIFSNPDVDGGLIGGASLNAKDFFAIVNAF